MHPLFDESNATLIKCVISDNVLQVSCTDHFCETSSVFFLYKNIQISYFFSCLFKNNQKSTARIECHHPGTDIRTTHAQTDGQPENIMLPALLIGLFIRTPTHIVCRGYLLANGCARHESSVESTRVVLPWFWTSSSCLPLCEWPEGLEARPSLCRPRWSPVNHVVPFPPSSSETGGSFSK